MKIKFLETVKNISAKIILGLCFAFSFFALVVSISGNGVLLQFDCKKVVPVIVDFIGIIFSVSGVVFTVYFVIMGLNVRKIQSEVDVVVGKIQSDINEVMKTNLEYQKVPEDIANEIYYVYSTLIALRKISNKSQKRHRKKKGQQDEGIVMLQHRLSLFGCHLKTLAKEERVNCMKNLVRFGESEDLDKLYSIVNDREEDDDIRGVARYVIESIRSRLGC